MRLHVAADVEYLIGLRSKNQPLSKDQIRAAKEAINRLTNEDLEHAGLAPPPIPVLKEEVHKLPGPERLAGLQSYISSFQYNFDHGYHFNISKRRPFNEIMNTSRCIAHAGLPIKCIEAVFLGLYVTARHSDWIRFPLWGCLGLSRKSNLMFKPLQFKSLSELMTDYKNSFAVWNHHVLKIRVGPPAIHNVFSTTPIVWRSCNLKVSVMKQKTRDSVESLKLRTTSSMSSSGIWVSDCSDSEDNCSRRRSRNSYRHSHSNNQTRR